MKSGNYKAMMCSLMLATSVMAVNAEPVLAAPVENVENAATATARSASVYIGKPVVSVAVAGNSNIAADKIMGAVKTKIGDKLDEDAVRTDMKSIYELGTFMDIVVHFDEVPEGVKITYTVIENPVLKDIIIEGNTKLTTEAIMGMLEIKKGEVINTLTFNQNARAVEEKYKKDGYIFAKMSDVDMGKDGVLKIRINEGTLEGYAVKGNEKTKERVITREMRMKIGEPFNSKDARRSMQRVYNLGFFEDVNMKINPGKEPNAVIMETDVVEKRTGTFSIGAGYSSADGVIGLLGIGDKNFRGTGDSINVQWEFGGDADSYDGYLFSYTRPWMDSKQTTGSIRIYNRTYEYDYYDRDGSNIATYDKRYQGFEVGFSRPVSEYSTNSITFKNRKDSYVDYVSGIDFRKTDGKYKNYIDENFGSTRSITLGHTTDTRDNIYNPTEGSFASLTTEFAGLGGKFNYQKYTLADQHYFKVGRNHVLALRGTIGLANGTLPEAALFDVGGQSTLRGYRDNQFEGKKMALGTVEYRFPLANKLKGAVFTDFGDAWTGSVGDIGLHASVGFGIQLDSPLGPIRLDYGRGSNGGRTHFSFGGSF